MKWLTAHIMQMSSPHTAKECQHPTRQYRCLHLSLPLLILPVTSIPLSLLTVHYLSHFSARLWNYEITQMEVWELCRECLITMGKSEEKLGVVKNMIQRCFAFNSFYNRFIFLAFILVNIWIPFCVKHFELP